MLRSPYLTARLLGIISLVTWCCSLSLPGLSLYSENKQLFGFEILLTGWLSPLMLNFAWFANIFFVFGLLKLLSGGAPSTSVLLAAILSIDTIRFDMYLLNEGGATTPIYGYGWGAVLWFVAIFTLLAAASLRERELSAIHSVPMQASGRHWLVGIVLAAVVLVGSSILSVHDHFVANVYESKRLTPLIAFKRTKVCDAPEPVAMEPLRNFSGILEVVSLEKKNSYSMSRYPFGQVKDLLEWGIPIVRVGNRDFYLTSSPKPEVMSMAATGQPSAILTHGGENWTGITARLVDAATERVIFDQTWSRENHGDINKYIYCPDYASFQSQDKQPRKLLLQALDLSDGKSVKQPTVEYGIFPQVSGTVIAQKGGGKTLKMIVAEKYPGLSTGEAFRYHSHELINANCPTDVGWDMQEHNVSMNTGRPFKMAGVAHYLRPRYGVNAICGTGAVYIYQGTDSHDTYYLNIEKRSIPDFHQIWAGIIVIPIATRRNDVLKVREIGSTSNGVTLELVNDDTGDILQVSAPLVDRN
jgi:hypothetical protein